MTTILHAVGTRPNLMKVASVMRALDAKPSIKQVLVHTGQHYDRNLSEVFFIEHSIKQPDVYLNVGGMCDHAQIAMIINRLPRILAEYDPDLIFVYGDVNSTLGCAIATAKGYYRLCHVESGLRSHDKTMPEEINRIIVDSISDVHYASCNEAAINLALAGVKEESIHLVGNTMIDSIEWIMPAAKKSRILQDHSLIPKQYGLVTLHRQSNVDDPRILEKAISCINDIAQSNKIAFPVHPRFSAKCANSSSRLNENVEVMSSVKHSDFVCLMSNALYVLTDSGGVQEETSYLDIPCFTARNNTERMITITKGTNTLVGNDFDIIPETLRGHMKNPKHLDGPIPLWDGFAAKRIADTINTQ